jgi:NADPH-dependent F420 reductase
LWSIPASVIVNFGVFTAAFVILTSEPLGWRDVVVGAGSATVFWEILQALGGVYIRHELAHATPTYGFFAIVIGLLSWLFIGAQLTLLAAEINVVRRYRLWPRSIVQPPLTDGDRRTFARLVRMEVRRPEVWAAAYFKPEADHQPLDVPKVVAPMTHVTIIGAGNMARGISTRLLAGGADVEIRDVDSKDARSLAEELGGSVPGKAVDEPLEGDVIVLATPYEAAVQLAEDRANELTGKVVIDITNPVEWSSFDRLVTPAESSAAEEIAKRIPGSSVVKAFNTTFAATLVDGEVAGQQLDVFLASDDDAAKARVRELVTAGGMRAIDAGPLRRARQLEQLGFLHMALQDGLGSEYRSAVKVVVP